MTTVTRIIVAPGECVRCRNLAALGQMVDVGHVIDVPGEWAADVQLPVKVEHHRSISNPDPSGYLVVSDANGVYLMIGQGNWGNGVFKQVESQGKTHTD